MDRRTFLTLAGLGSVSKSFAIEVNKAKEKKYKVGITDWDINAKCDPKAFQIAKECGLDGIQLSYIPQKKDRDLTQKMVRDEFLAESKKHHVEIASMAMGVFNSFPFMNTPDAELWVTQCLDIMSDFNQKVVLLAFFGKGNIKDKPEMQKLVIERLKKIAPLAEKKGIQIGLETWLNMEEHMRILDAVGSSAVKVYYDTANMNKMGYNITQEIRWLGKKNAICQIHLKEKGERLGSGKIKFPEVKNALEEIDYRDWLIIESGIKNGRIDSAKANCNYVNKLFNHI